MKVIPVAVVMIGLLATVPAKSDDSCETVEEQVECILEEGVPPEICLGTFASPTDFKPLTGFSPWGQFIDGRLYVGWLIADGGHMQPGPVPVPLHQSFVFQGAVYPLFGGDAPCR